MFCDDKNIRFSINISSSKVMAKYRSRHRQIPRPDDVGDHPRPRLGREAHPSAPLISSVPGHPPFAIFHGPEIVTIEISVDFLTENLNCKGLNKSFVESYRSITMTFYITKTVHIQDKTFPVLSSSKKVLQLNKNFKEFSESKINFTKFVFADNLVK